jgi:hypothetical protein
MSPSEVEIGMKRNEPLNGMISHLTREHGGNVHQNGVVTLSAPSRSDLRDSALEHVVDLESSNWYLSVNEPGQWICWDFGERMVLVIMYTIRTFWLRSWVLEGAMNPMDPMDQWTQIDQRMNIEKFEGLSLFHFLPKAARLVVASFSVDNKSLGPFRCIRLRQTDRTFRNEDALRLAGVEFFGTLVE